MLKNVKGSYYWLSRKLDRKYPFLVSLFPLIFVFSKYVKDFSYGILLIPLFVIIGLVLGFVLLFRLILKNDKKVFFIIAFGALGLLYYGFFYDFLFGLKVNGFLLGRHRYLFPFWGALFASFGIFFLFTKRNISKLAEALKFCALALILAPIINVGIFELKDAIGYSEKPKVQINQEADVKNKEQKKEKIPSINAGISNLPDIYYILPDQYARSDVLREYFDYDNKEFIGFLKDKGFVIPEKGRSNYMITIFSLAATLNMDYVDNLIDLPEEDSTDFDPLIEKIKNNKVKNIVESAGYRYIYLSSDALVVGVKDTGDDIIESNFDTFMRQALQTTVLRPFGGRYSFKEKNINKWARERVLNTFNQLSKVPTSNLKGPKFVFAHIMAPHGPYVFGRNGEETKLSFVKSMTYQEDMQAFLDQSIYVSKKILETVDQIISKSENPPIIIIQSDHGHYLDRELVDENLRREIRTRNFTALFLPGKDKKFVPKDLATVNTFRLIFDQYFGTKLGFLENKSYIYDGGHPYRFEEIK